MHPIFEIDMGNIDDFQINHQLIADFRDLGYRVEKIEKVGDGHRYLVHMAKP